MRLIQATCYERVYALIRPAGIEIKSDTSISWIHTNIFRLSCMKLGIGLKNFKGVFASV